MMTRLRFALPVLTAALAAGCSSDGPTAIEIPIARVEIVASCGSLVVNETCTFRAEAYTAEDQLVQNAVLRWSSSSTNVATVEEQGTSGLVRARNAGEAQIIVSNTTGSVSDSRRVLVLPENPK